MPRRCRTRLLGETCQASFPPCCSPPQQPFSRGLTTWSHSKQVFGLLSPPSPLSYPCLILASSTQPWWNGTNMRKCVRFVQGMHWTAGQYRQACQAVAQASMSSCRRIQKDMFQPYRPLLTHPFLVFLSCFKKGASPAVACFSGICAFTRIAPAGLKLSLLSFGT